MPRPLLKFVRPKGVPPGPLETEVLRPALEQRGLLSVKEEPRPDEEDQGRRWDEEEEPLDWFCEQLDPVALGYLDGSLPDFRFDSLIRILAWAVP